MSDDEPLHVICVPAEAQTPFDDNVRGVCATCGRAVQHRPYVPPAGILTCVFCYQAVVESGEEIEAFVMRRTIEEVLALLHKTRD